MVTTLATRSLALLAFVLASTGPTTARAQDTRLDSVPLQKAAVKCQKAIAQVGAKVIAGKLKALDACAAAALACVQTKFDKPECRAKAGQVCVKKLSSAAAAASAGKTKILATKSCTQDLRLPDLLAPDGLGLGRGASSCLNDFGIDVCSSVDALAECLVRTHERAAAELHGVFQPRTDEILALLPDVVLPVVDGLPAFEGCENCSVAPAARKAVETCGRTVPKATHKLVVSLEKQLNACSQKVFECVQKEDAKPDCLIKAQAACTKGTVTIGTAADKLSTTIGKACGGDGLGFDELLREEGLNLAAVGTHCLAVGAPPLVGIDAFTECLERRARCTVGALVRGAVARTSTFADADLLGDATADLSASCPALDTPLLLTRRAARAPIFGSILKFVKGITRPSTGTPGVRRVGTPPVPAFGAARAVLAPGTPPRVVLGGITKLPFTYRLPAGRARTGTPRATEAPSLVVAIERAGVEFEDHFEIILEPPSGATEVSDTTGRFGSTIEEPMPVNESAQVGFGCTKTSLAVSSSTTSTSWILA